MHVQKSGALPRLVAIISVMIALMLGTSLSIANANTDEGVEETPIVATATATAEITGDPVIEVPEVEATEVDSAAKGKKPETKPTSTATVEPAEDPTEDPTEEPTQAPTDDPTVEPTEDPTEDPTVEPTEDPTEDPTVEPTEDPTEDPTEEQTEDPTEEQTPPMNQFVDVVVGECQVAITQKMGVDWTEVIADNGDPSHWGITKGNPTLVVKPVDSTKDLVVRIIPVISLEEAWEYSVTLEASASCDEPDPGPKPDPKSGNLVESSLVCHPQGGGTVTTTTTPWTQDWVLEDGKWVLGEVVSGYPVQDQRDATEQECPVTKPTPTPTPTDPPTTGEPTDPPTSTPTPDPTDPPSGEPTGEPTPADPPTTGEPSDPPTSTPTKAPTTAPSGDGDRGSDKSDPKGPAKTGAIGDDSTDAILAGTALAAIMTSALVAVRMKRRPGGKYAARS